MKNARDFGILREKKFGDKYSEVVVKRSEFDNSGK